jgi:hypothetical protein
MLIIPSFGVSIVRASGMDQTEDTKKTTCEQERLNDCAR